MSDIVERALRQAASSGVALYEEAATEITALRAELAAVQRGKAAALGLVEGHAAIIRSLEAELAAAKERAATLERERDSICDKAVEKTLALDAAEAKAEGLGAWIEQQAPSIVALYRFDSSDDERRAQEAFAILAARAGLHPRTAKEPGHGH